MSPVLFANAPPAGFDVPGVGHIGYATLLTAVNVFLTGITFFSVRYLRRRGRQLNRELRERCRWEAVRLVAWAATAPTWFGRWHAWFRLAHMHELVWELRDRLLRSGIDLGDRATARRLRAEVSAGRRAGLFAEFAQFAEGAIGLTPREDAAGEAAKWEAVALRAETDGWTVLAKAVRAVGPWTVGETWSMLDGRDHAALLPQQMTDVLTRSGEQAARLDALMERADEQASRLDELVTRVADVVGRSSTDPAALAEPPSLAALGARFRGLRALVVAALVFQSLVIVALVAVLVAR